MKRRVSINRSVVVVSLAALLLLVGGVPQAWSRPRLTESGTLLQTVVPSMVSYQGRVNVGGIPFDDKGYFKFAIVDPAGPETLWSNDGSSAGGDEPEEAIQLTVVDGLFDVLLGDTSVPNMTEPLLPEYIADRDCYLRVWFSPDAGTFQQLSPDRRIASVPFALIAEEAVNANTLRDYAPGNSSGRIPINNGTLNSNLNADKLDGQHGGFYRNASNINAGTLSTDRFSAHADLSKEGYLGDATGDLAQNNGLLQQGLNADAVDGRHAEGLMVPGGAIVWGIPNDGRLTAAGYVDLGPSRVISELWRATSTAGAPDARDEHTTVYAGTLMIVWGGRCGLDCFLNSGGRYDPAWNDWAPVTTVNAPSSRSYHTAVWTGSEMIVWGGWYYDGSSTYYYNDGARYNPATNTWTVMTTTNAPTARRFHTAVWTGSEMIVWGGEDSGYNQSNTGGRYNPTTDTWTDTTTTNAPTGRSDHTAVWAGSQMIVWGGGAPGSLDTGGRYNPATDAWTDTTTTNAPEQRKYHTAVWTGSEMIVWGGTRSVSLNTGGRYNPTTNTWTDTTTTNAPSAREFHSAVWTGSEMWVWGGGIDPGYDALNTGARYDPALDAWFDISTSDAPAAREDHSAVWTGSQMVVWGGAYQVDMYTLVRLNNGGRYCQGLHLYEKM
jgi:N-acetylneuraminic acid mutarotase